MNYRTVEFWDKVMEEIDPELAEDAACGINTKAPPTEPSVEIPAFEAKEFKAYEPVKKRPARFALPIAAAALVLVTIGIFAAGMMKHLYVENSSGAEFYGETCETQTDTDNTEDILMEIDDENILNRNLPELTEASKELASHIITRGDMKDGSVIPNDVEDENRDVKEFITNPYRIDMDLYNKYFGSVGYPTMRYKSEYSAIDFGGYYMDEYFGMSLFIDDVNYEIIGLTERPIYELEENVSPDVKDYELNKDKKVCYLAMKEYFSSDFYCPVVFCAVPYEIDGKTETIFYRGTIQFLINGFSTPRCCYDAVYTTLTDDVCDYEFYGSAVSVPTDWSNYNMYFDLFEKYFSYEFIPHGDSEDVLNLNYSTTASGHGEEYFMFGRTECIGFYEESRQNGGNESYNPNKVCYMAVKTGDSVTLYCAAENYVYNGNPTENYTNITLYRYDSVKEGETLSRGNYNAVYTAHIPESAHELYPKENLLSYFGLLKLCDDYGLPIEQINDTWSGRFVRDTSIPADWGIAEVLEQGIKDIKLIMRFYTSDEKAGNVLTGAEQLKVPYDVTVEYKFNDREKTWELQKGVSTPRYIPENDKQPVLTDDPEKESAELYRSMDFLVFEKYFCGTWEGKNSEGEELSIEIDYHNDVWHWGESSPGGVYETEQGYFLRSTNRPLSRLYYIPRYDNNTMYVYGDLSFGGFNVYPQDYELVFSKTSGAARKDMEISGKLSPSGMWKMWDIINDDKAHEAVTDILLNGSVSYDGSLFVRKWHLDGGEYGEFILNTPEEELQSADNLSFTVKFTRDQRGSGNPVFKYFTIVVEKGENGIWTAESIDPSDYADSYMK